MSEDVVERLRQYAVWLSRRSYATLDGRVCDEAAAEIERLRAENATLKAAIAIPLGAGTRPNFTRKEMRAIGDDAFRQMESEVSDE